MCFSLDFFVMFLLKSVKRCHWLILTLLFVSTFSLRTYAQPVDPDIETLRTQFAKQLLSNIANANSYYSYKGLLTYEADGHLSTMVLHHKIDSSEDQKVIYQQLAFLDGTSRQVVRTQSLEQCRADGSRWGLWPGSFNVDKLVRHYAVKLIGSERLANRKTYVVDLQPKDEFRYGYRFNIDEKTGLLLKFVIKNQNEMIERTQFITLGLSDWDTDDLLSEEYDISWRVSETDPCHTDQFNSAWSVGWLPDGFFPAGNRVTSQGEQVLMFSDGLISISVFITDHQYNKRIEKITANRGATVAVLSSYSLDNTKTIAVVGEVPTVTARRIAVSVKPK